MSDKVIITGLAILDDPDPWEQGMVTERLPAQEMWDDGIEPADPPFELDSLEDDQRDDCAA